MSAALKARPSSRAWTGGKQRHHAGRTLHVTELKRGSTSRVNRTALCRGGFLPQGRQRKRSGWVVGDHGRRFPRQTAEPQTECLEPGRAVEVQRRRTRLLTLTEAAQVINDSAELHTDPGAAEGRGEVSQSKSSSEAASQSSAGSTDWTRRTGARRPEWGAAVTRARTGEGLHRGEKPAGSCQHFKG